MFDYINPNLVTKKMSLNRAKISFLAWFNYQKLKSKTPQEVTGILLKQSPEVRIKLLLQQDIRNKIDLVNNNNILKILNINEKTMLVSNLSHDELLRGLYSDNFYYDCIHLIDDKVWIAKLSLNDIIAIASNPSMVSKLNFDGFLRDMVSNLSEKDKFTIINNPNVLNNYNILALLSNLKLTAGEMEKIINNSPLVNKLGVTGLLSILSLDEIGKAIDNPNIISKLRPNDLIQFLSSLSINGLVELVSNHDVLSKLGPNGLSQLSNVISSDKICEALKNKPELYENHENFNFIMDLLSKYSPATLVQSIEKYDILNILDLNRLFSKLSLETMMKLISDNNKILDKINFSNLNRLLSNLSPELTAKLLDNPVVLQKLDLFSLEKLLLNMSPDLISKSLKNPYMLNKLDSSSIETLLSKLSSDVINNFLNDSNIINKLDSKNLQALISKLSLTDKINKMENQVIFHKLGAFNPKDILSTTKPEEVRAAFADSKMLDKLISYRFMSFLLSKLSPKEIIDKLNDPKIFSNLFSVDLCEVLLKLPPEEIIRKLNDDKVLDKLYSDNLLELFLKLPPEDIHNQLTNMKILNKFSSNDLTSLLSALSLSVTFDLIDNTEIAKKIVGDVNYESFIKHQDLFRKIIEKSGNCSILNEVNFNLFRDDIISSLSSDIFEKLCAYKEVAEQVVDLFNSSDNLGKYFSLMFDAIKNQHFTADMNFDLLTLQFISSLKNEKSNILKFVKNVDVNSLSPQEFSELTSIALSCKKSIDVSLNNKEDLKTYDERFNKKCDELFNNSLVVNNIDNAKDVYFNKYYRMSLDYAKETIRLYGYSLESLDLSDESVRKNYDYLISIKNILDVQDVSTLKDIYYNSVSWSFDELLSFEQSIPQMYAKNMSDSLYKIDCQKVKENVKFELDGATYDIPVYEPEVNENGRYDFKMLVHSTNAYGSMNIENHNYYEAWNNSSRVRNHGICCGLISNSYMGFPPVNGSGVIFGFDSFSNKSLTASGPYDLGTGNDSYQINQGIPNMYMTADDMINTSRDTHNEQTIERREMRDDMTESKLQPSYVIITEDMSEELRDNAYKCAAQMNIPIVILNKKKIGEKESEYIDKRIEELNNVQDENKRMDILRDILTVHENNRAGERIIYENESDELFPTSRIQSVFANEVRRAIQQYQSGDMISFNKTSNDIMNILDSENEKYSFGRARTQMDFSVDTYEESLMELIPECQADKDKFREIVMVFARSQVEEMLKSQELESQMEVKGYGK